MGRGILTTDKIVFLKRTKPTLRLAIKVESIKHDSANSGVNTMKAAAKIAFPLMKLKAGDQKSTPTTKMPDATRLMRVPNVKEEFINC